MNDYLRRTTDWMSSTVARARALVDPPLTADARPIEIRAQLLDDIDALVEPSGTGRRVFPYSEVIITIVATDAARQAALDAALADVESQARARLDELRCERRGPLTVHVEYVPTAPVTWAVDQQYAISCRAAGAPARPDAPPPAVLHLDVVRGTAAAASYSLHDTHIRIGRTTSPIDDRGQLRHNHVVFLDDDVESATVGRAHASIRYDAARGDYRLFDDGSANGTRIVRAGTVLTVAPRDPVGVTLASGDEILLGSASLRVTVAEGAEIAETSSRGGR